MNSKEFVIWLNGFTEGVHEYNVTPKQWDILKEKLAGVSDQTYPFGTPNGTVTIANPNIATFTSSGSLTYPIPGATVTYTNDGRPNWYTTTVANEKTLLND
jgi:hypothetical protein